jgi:hypothetical protein
VISGGSIGRSINGFSKIERRTALPLKCRRACRELNESRVFRGVFVSYTYEYLRNETPKLYQHGERKTVREETTKADQEEVDQEDFECPNERGSVEEKVEGIFSPKRCHGQ